MKNRRTQFFFGLGVIVLPVFWSWFTLARGFSNRERFAAFAGMAVTLGFLAANWPALEEFGSLVAYGYTIVLESLTLALWAWLVYRIGVRITLIEGFMLFFVFGNPRLFFDLQHDVGRPFSWLWFVPPLIPAILHLLVDPIRALFQKWRWIRPM